MKWLWVALLAVNLLGCQSQPGVVDGEPQGDLTGELGAPIKRQSPGDVYVELGIAYLKEGNVSEAFRNARKATLIDPQLAAGHNLLGILQQRLGQMGEAKKHYRRAVELEPRNPYALNALGTFLCAQAEFDSADGYLARALENPLYPTPWVAAYNRGQCAESKQDKVAAERHYRFALRKQAEFAPALIRMASLSFEQENYLSARAYLQRYAAVAPHTAASLWLGVRTERKLDDKDQVASYALQLRAKFPDSEEVRLLNEM